MIPASCHRCNHPVSTTATSCSRCGVAIPAQTRTASGPPPEHAPGPPRILNSPVRTESAAPLGSTPARIGIAGVALLTFGVFAPFISAPVVGSLTYFQNGKGDGTIILVLAAVAAGMIFAGGTRWLILPGLASLALLSYVYVTFQTKMSEIRAELASQDLGIFSGLGQMMVQSVQLQWGFGLLVMGALLVTSAGVIAPRDEQTAARGRPA